MSETTRIDAHVAQPRAPAQYGTPAWSAEQYRVSGVLDADRMAAAIIAKADGDGDHLGRLRETYLAPDGPLSPVERGRMMRALDRAEGMSIGEHAWDGARQFGGGVANTVVGLWGLGVGLAKTSYDLSPAGFVADGVEWVTGAQAPVWMPDPGRGAGRVGAAADGIAQLGRAVWDDPSILIEQYQDLADDGRWGAIGGQLLADFGDVFVGTKGAGRAGALARAAGRADDLADAGRAASVGGALVRAGDAALDPVAIARWSDSAGEFARTVRAAPGGTDEAAGTLRATRSTLDALDQEALTPDAARAVRAARDEIELTLRGERSEWLRDPVAAASRQSGLEAREVFGVLDAPFGARPAPSTYMSEGAIRAHLAAFDEGAVRVIKKADFEQYGTLAPPGGGFALPAREFSRLVDEAGGDLAAVERSLGLRPGHLTSGDNMIVHVERQHLGDLRVPTGNEPGVKWNPDWLPGGYTAGGVPEAVMDLPAGTPFREITLGGRQ